MTESRNNAKFEPATDPAESHDGAASAPKTRRIGKPAFMSNTRIGMRIAMIVSLVIYVVACLTFVPLWGNHGLWGALLIFMGARGVTLGVRYPALERSVGSPQAGT